MHVLGMIQEEYNVMAQLTTHVLQETPGINMQVTITKQPSRRAVEAVKEKLARKRPEWRVFQDDNYWPLECFIYKALKASKEKFVRLNKKLKLAQDKANAQGDIEGEADAIEKRKKLAWARGMASANARAQTRAREQPAPEPMQELTLETAQQSILESTRSHELVQAQVAVDSGAEPQISTDEYGWDKSNRPTSNEVDADVEEALQDLTNMSLCPPVDGDVSMAEGNLGAVDDNLGALLLPDKLSNPPPPSQTLATATLALPETSLPASAPLLTNLSSEPKLSLAGLQDSLQQVAANLSPKACAQLPPDIQLYLKMLDSRPETSSSQPPAWLANTHSIASNAPNATLIPPSSYSSLSTPAPALPSKEKPRPKMRPLPPSSMPPVPQLDHAHIPTLSTGNALALTEPTSPLSVSNAVAGSIAKPVSSLSSKFLRIDQLEPGPSTIQIDDDEEEPFTDVSSGSESNQDLQTKSTGKQAKTATKNASKDTTPTMELADEGLVPTKGNGKGKVNGGAERIARKNADTKGIGKTRSRGRRDVAIRQASQGNDSKPASQPANSSSRTTRSMKTA
ncbi:hypothetical protein RHS04_00001 [Rhizoctonia solani]|uniref:Uncharacterized protein n=1 Tax=Rhizoctonia solani TaxID=456999 RepID=A0A8H7HIA2_9AGAM|nr:hypothetical protein RHS04_00001 [Rhizoctonia solani]